MALGAVLVIVGLILVSTGGDDPSEQSKPVEPTTTIATSTTTTTTVVTTTVTSTTTTTTPAESPEVFLGELNLAFESGDAEFLLGRLNEAVLERYGVDQCASYLSEILPQSQGLSMRREVGVGPWKYSTDGVATSLAGVTAIEVDRMVNGETRINELHWKMVGGVFTWFTDCGTPLIID